MVMGNMEKKLIAFVFALHLKIDLFQEKPVRGTKAVSEEMFLQEDCPEEDVHYTSRHD